MATLREALLPTIDRLRGLPDKLGLRLYTVTVRARQWSGSRVGLGSNTDSDTSLYVDLGVHHPKIEQVSQKDIIASGGLYADLDLKVGPITPPFDGSFLDADAVAIWDPTPGAPPTELFFLIKGPGFPSSGGWFKKISQNVTKNFRYDFVVRQTAELP